MKKLVISLSLLIAASIGSFAQAQGPGGSLKNQLKQKSPQLNDQRLQNVQNLESQLQQQDGGNQTRSAVVQDGGQVGPQDGQLEGGPGPLPGGDIGNGPQNGNGGDGFGAGIGDGGFGGGAPIQDGSIQPGLGGQDDGPIGGQIPTANIQESASANAVIQEGAIGQDAFAPGADGVIVEENIQVETGLRVAAQRISIGALVESIPEAGLRILRVADGSKAQLIGLEPGDLIQRVNRIPISSAIQFEALLEQADELHLNRLNLLVRNGRYGENYGIPEFSILQLRLAYSAPVIIEEYHRPYVREYEYIQPRPVYGGSCHYSGGGCHK